MHSRARRIITTDLAINEKGKVFGSWKLEGNHPSQGTQLTVKRKDITAAFWQRWRALRSGSEATCRGRDWCTGSRSLKRGWHERTLPPRSGTFDPRPQVACFPVAATDFTICILSCWTLLNASATIPFGLVGPNSCILGRKSRILRHSGISNSAFKPQGTSIFP
jgi:hypothetical protein